MSHALGRVFLMSGEEMGSFEYNGNVDVACTAVAPEATILAQWRTDANERECQCSPAVEAAVTLVADYGNGKTWTSRACLTCLTIVGQRDPYAAPDDSEPLDVNPMARGLLP